MKVMQQPGPDLPYSTVPEAPRSDGKIGSGLHQYLAGRCCENLQSAWGPEQ